MAVCQQREGSYLPRIPCTSTTRWSGSALSCSTLWEWDWRTGTNILLMLALPPFNLFVKPSLPLPWATAISKGRFNGRWIDSCCRGSLKTTWMFRPSTKHHAHMGQSILSAFELLPKTFPKPSPTKPQGRNPWKPKWGSSTVSAAPAFWDQIPSNSMTKSLPEYHLILLYSFFPSPQTTHTHTNSDVLNSLHKTVTKNRAWIWVPNSPLPWKWTEEE